MCAHLNLGESAAKYIQLSGILHIHVPQPAAAAVQAIAAAAHSIAAYDTAADTQSVAEADLVPGSFVAIPIATDTHLSSWMHSEL